MIYDLFRLSDFSPDSVCELYSQLYSSTRSIYMSQFLPVYFKPGGLLGQSRPPMPGLCSRDFTFFKLLNQLSYTSKNQANVMSEHCFFSCSVMSTNQGWLNHLYPYVNKVEYDSVLSCRCKYKHITFQHHKLEMTPFPPFTQKEKANL